MRRNARLFDFGTSTTTPRARYQLQTTTDLGADSWFDMGDPVPGSGAALIFETPYDRAEKGAQTAFRVPSLPPPPDTDR